MKYIKYLVFYVALIGWGCTPKASIEGIDFPLPPPPPFPPDLSAPTSPPPPFIPSMKEVAEIQINPLPHPFNVNGTLPYAVWVNGEKLILNHVQTQALTKSLNLEFKQPENTAEIHSGEGWLFPLDLK